MRSPQLYWLRPLLKEVEKPEILNCSIGKKTSSFVSDITKISTFPIT